MPTEPKPPILSVLFVHESGDIESYRPEEIRRNPETFKAICADHLAAGRRPMAMRAHRVPA